MNADPELDAAVLGHAGVALDHRAQRTASTTLRNSTMAPLPVRLTTRPL